MGIVVTTGVEKDRGVDNALEMLGAGVEELGAEVEELEV